MIESPSTHLDIRVSVILFSVRQSLHEPLSPLGRRLGQLLDNQREQVTRFVPEADRDVLAQDVHRVSPAVRVALVAAQGALVQQVPLAVQHAHFGDAAGACAWSVGLPCVCLQVARADPEDEQEQRDS